MHLNRRVVLYKGRSCIGNKGVLGFLFIVIKNGGNHVNTILSSFIGRGCSILQSRMYKIYKSKFVINNGMCTIHGKSRKGNGKFLKKACQLSCQYPGVKRKINPLLMVNLTDFSPVSYRSGGSTSSRV